MHVITVILTNLNMCDINWYSLVSHITSYCKLFGHKVFKIVNKQFLLLSIYLFIYVHFRLLGIRYQALTYDVLWMWILE